MKNSMRDFAYPEKRRRPIIIDLDTLAWQFVVGVCVVAVFVLVSMVA